MRALVLAMFVASLVACAGDGADAPQVSTDQQEAIVLGVVADPTSLAYGSVAVGSSVTQQVSVLAAAHGVSATLTSYDIANCPAFTVTNYTITACNSLGCFPGDPESLTADGDGLVAFSESVYDTDAGSRWVTFDIKFAPGAAATSNCTFVVTSNVNNVSSALSGTGTGGAPIIQLTEPSSGSLSFTSRRINTTSTTQQFTVRNGGNVALAISSVATATDADDWVISFDTSTTIAAGATRSGTVAFSPKTAGSANTQLRIASNDPQTPTLSFPINGTGQVANAGTNVSSLTVPATVVNEPQTASFTMTNTGTAPYTIAGTSITGTNAADFTVTQVPTTVAGGSTTSTVTVQCRPSAVGTRTASLKIDTDADNTPQDPSVALSCQGVKPDIGTNPTSVDFANVAPGASSQRIVTVTNASGTNASSLVVSSLAITGTNPGDFSVSPPGGFTLLAGGSRDLTITFVPATFGSRSANLRIVSDDQETPNLDVPLTGNGFGPEITLTAPSGGTIGFGDVPVGQPSGSQTVTVRNDGNTGLVISDVSLIGTNPADFAFSGSTGTVSGGSTKSWGVTCTPTVAGNRAATLRIVSNDPNEANTDIALTCNGTSGALTVVSPATPIAFTATDVGASSAPVTVTLRNSGSADVTITASPTVSAGPFSISTPLSAPVTLVPGGTATVGLTFTPTADGTASATLSVPYTAPAAQTLSVGLTGTGRAALVAVSATSLPLGSVVVGATPGTGSFAIQNAGSATLNIASIAHSGSPDVTLTAAAPTSVGAAGTVNVGVRCAPASTGAKSATFTIDTDADNAPQDPVVTVTCTGVVPEIALVPTLLDFGDVAPGTPVSHDIVVMNASNATTSTLSVSAPSIAGPNAGDFTVSPAGAFTLEPGGDRTISVRFTPGAFGARSATLTIASDDPDGAINVPLNGFGRAPELTVASPATGTIPFGSVKIGDSATPASVILRNDGNDDLSISGVVTLGTSAAEFVVLGPDTPATITGGTSRSWTVECRPTSTGSKSATLRVTSNDADEGIQDYLLTCTGTQAMLAMEMPSTQPVTFQSTRVGEVSTGRTITLRNTGDAPLTIIGAAHATPAAFEIVTNVPANTVVAPNATVNLELRFRPTVDGIVTGNLTVDWDTTSLLIDLRGPGTLATMTVTPDVDIEGQVDIGAVCAGMPRAQTFTLRSTGTGPFRIDTIEVTGTGFAVTHGTLPITLSQTQQTAFTLTATAAATETLSGTITVTTDIPSAVTRTLPVIATGIDGGIGIAPSSHAVDFGSVAVGTQTASTAVTVTNCAATTMNVAEAGLTGTDGDEFLVSGPSAFPQELATNASAQWLVRYAPGNEGASSAALHLVHDQAGSPVDITLAGYGGTPPADAGPDAAEPDADTGGDDDAPADDEGLDKTSYYACSASGSPGPGWLLGIGIALALVRRRRRP